MDPITSALKDAIRHERVRMQLDKLDKRIIEHIAKIQILRNKHNVKDEIGTRREENN